MSHDHSQDPDALYDRQLLLFGAKRESVLALREVRRYGVDSFADADHVSVYGMPPADWYDRGIRLLGRTVVECTVDGLADGIATDVAALAASAPPTSGTLVIDPFVGSGNTLYWIQRRLPGSSGLGFELDAGVFQLTKRNLAELGAPVEVVNIDYAAGLAGVTDPGNRLVIVFLAPPWGAAFDRLDGLDLRRAEPPVTEIMDLLIRLFPDTLFLFAIQAYEKVEPTSLTELEARCDWSARHVYHLNESGQNPAVLLGTRRWTPR